MVGWSTRICSKRRSSAESRSRYLRYSSSVVAPMGCSSPRARAGLRIEGAADAADAAAARGPRSGAARPSRADRGRVRAPPRGPRADEIVELVDEQDDVAALG